MILTEVKKGNIRCEFVYDAFSRRIQKRIFTDGKLTKHLKFAYSGFNCVGEIDASSGKVLMNYVWNNNELLGAVDNESKSYSYLTDGNRNIIKILDSDRNSAAEYSYSPFSEQIKCSGDFAEKNPFRFSSEYFDSETGLVYYNFRYYNPEMGRWLSKDPIEEKGGMNLYAMLGNKSVNALDYLGLVFRNLDCLNCLGYATQEWEGISPSKGESMETTMTQLGWKCKKTLDACECEPCEKKLVLYIYSYKNGTEGKDPWKDPWVHKYPNDFHAIRCDLYKIRGEWCTYISHNTDVTTCNAKIETTPEPANPDSYWTSSGGEVPQERYCCCKSKKAE